MSKPSLAQLEAFVRIADSGTFMRAAEQLSVTQPTVSQRIRELENVIGSPLFTRQGRRTSLTAVGASLVHYARRVLAAGSEFEQQMRSVGVLSGTLRLGMTETFARVCLVDLLRSLAEHYPHLEASVLVGDSGAMEGMLEEKTLDIAVLVEASAGAGILVETAGFNEIAWVASPRLNMPDRVTPRDLVDQHILLPSAVSKVYSTVHDWFSSAGLSPARLSLCNSVTVIVQAVTAGLAVSVQPVRLTAEDVRRRRLRRLIARPALPAHRVSIAYQTHTLGHQVSEIAARHHELIARHRLFLPLR